MIWITAGFFATCLPPFLALLISAPIELLGLSRKTPYREVADLSRIVLASGFFAWVGMIPGVLVARFLALKGKAGWGSAILAGVVLPSGVFFAVSPDLRAFIGVALFFGGIGAVYAGSLWVMLRLLAPSLFFKMPQNG